jgi:hypothetical protein
MANRNDDLEFISVSQEDEEMSMNSANRTNFDDDSGDSVIGGSFLKFSKVNLNKCLLYIIVFRYELF